MQEAKAASALNHPNIITIYDIDTAGGVTFIAMEYVKGKTLDRLIRGKGAPLGETLKHAVQIADALAAAHAAGIIHRDIKPSNIMVTEAGLVKVLDFGLAKLTEIPESSEDQPTRTLKAETEEGVILGTVAYMSPEQAEGKPVDARSDIFSFGSVLYEMLTGRRAFSGETRVSTQAAILRQEPRPVSQVALETPRELERIVSRCLRKDPLRRFQHMDEVKIALEELKEESGSGSAVAVAPRRRRRSLLAAALAALVAAAAAWYWLSRPGPPASDLQPVPLTSSGIARWPSFSPDGNRVAFSWNGEKEDNFDIYEQQIGSNAPPLRLTSDPAQDVTPAWSPDDRYIAFVRQQGDGRALYLIPALGGPERKIAELAITPSWTPDSKWLAASLQDSPDGQRRSIWLISVETGERRRLTNPLAGLGDDYPAVAFVNLIWPLLMLSFGPTWPLFRLPLQTPLLDPLP